MNILKKWWFWALLIIIIAIGFLIFFKFGEAKPTIPVTSDYICPTDWVNCMPSPDYVNEYCAWVKKNCPDAKIAV